MRCDRGGGCDYHFLLGVELSTISQGLTTIEQLSPDYASDYDPGDYRATMTQAGKIKRPGLPIWKAGAVFVVLGPILGKHHARPMFRLAAGWRLAVPARANMAARGVSKCRIGIITCAKESSGLKRLKLAQNKSPPFLTGRAGCYPRFTRSANIKTGSRMMTIIQIMRGPSF